MNIPGPAWGGYCCCRPPREVEEGGGGSWTPDTPGNTEDSDEGTVPTMGVACFCMACFCVPGLVLLSGTAGAGLESTLNCPHSLLTAILRSGETRTSYLLL